MRHRDVSPDRARSPAIVLVTNIPSPYRLPIFDLLGERFPGLTVIYCKSTEPDRSWKVPALGHPSVFLNSATLSVGGRFVHLGLNIVPKLARLNPDVVVTTQYYPACLLAFLWAKAFRRKHICMYDGWEGFDRGLGRVHRLLRALFYRHSDAFVGVSTHTRRLFESYGVPTGGRFFWSPLCIDNGAFARTPPAAKEYDLMLSGRIVDIKLPEFTASVLAEVARRRPSLRVLIIGSGDRLPWLTRALGEAGVRFECPGFIQPGNLPSWYRRARILLLPTSGDCWGLVANEAMASGVPVITTPWAGAKDDLVRHGENGYVLPAEAGEWTEHILRLLEDEGLYASFSGRCLAAVEPYTFANAAQGIAGAIEHVLGKSP